MSTHEKQPSSDGRSERAVVVTGSSGLIGSRLCRELTGSCRVVGLDNDPPRGDVPSDWIECDFSDDDSVTAAFERLASEHGRSLASVIHLVAYYDFSGEPSPLYDQVTVGGTRRLMEALADFEVEQVVFTSSLLVVRPAREEEVLDESSAVGAAWDYPKSKLDSERVLRERAGDTPIVVLRVAGVYDEDCRSVPIAQQMRRIFERRLESYFFPGNPDHGQSFVHLDDLVRCIGAAVERRAELGPHEVFLVGEPDVVSYAEMQDVLGQLIHHREWPTIRIPAPVAKAGAWVKEKAGADLFIKPWMIDLADAHRPISIHKAEERLEWRPRHRLRDMLPEMTSRLIVNPASWYEKNGIDPPDDLEELQARRLERARERVRQGG